MQRPVLLSLASIFLGVLPAAAQTQTAVSGTITDPNGIPYANGTVSIQLVLPPGSNPPPTVNGAEIQGAFNVGLGATGNFQASLWPNSSIVPASTQWSFTVCSNPGGIQPPLGTGTQCTPPTAITISGTAQVLSTTLSNVAPKLTNFASTSSGSVTSVAATAPIVVTPSPITGTGTVSCPTCSTSGTGTAASGQSLADVNSSIVGANTLTWNRLGVVIDTPLTTEISEEISCWVQTSPQILTTYTQVVACVHNFGTGINYSEAPSPEGPFTDYASNPVLTPGGCPSNVLSLGGQLVMWYCTNSRADIHRAHSTTNGLSWVDDGAEITHGSGWLTNYAENPFVLVINGTCVMWFEGSLNTNNLAQGVATSSSSTCAQGTFVQNAGNPVIPDSEFNGGGPFVYYDGTNYWQWEHGTPGGSISPYPTDIYFTQLNTNGIGTLNQTHTKIFTSRTDDEGANNTSSNRQVADPFLLEWPFAQGDPRNSTYMFYTACANTCTGGQVMATKVAVIPLPIGQIAKMTQGDTMHPDATLGWPFVHGLSAVSGSGSGVSTTISPNGMTLCNNTTCAIQAAASNSQWRVTGAGNAGNGSAFFASGTIPSFGWRYTSGGTDQKMWDVFPGPNLTWRAVNDANSSATNWMVALRGSGASVSAVQFLEPLQSTGTGAVLTGTGACATLATQSGGAWAGQVSCTGSNGASTLTITPGNTAPHGNSCSGSDVTHTLAGSQSAVSATACTLTFASVTTNDILIFSLDQY